ncbi:TetR/AcrR family transcriptional regulator [Nakamurella alba]|uniref:TetR/AcrR family transcriptional regulator n=1 Tax=Nakamurella alba TaxID=2665158 RepID=UPI002AC328F0|nr:TetR/AcrR family transcriptional regulator [Nakamurella alba]
MISRADSAAATRDALLEAAGALLDEGGPDAVTLRAVGARAGVSRGAPYGHFRDKEDLLTAVAVEAWTVVAVSLENLRGSADLSPRERLRQALLAMVDLGRHRPHLYARMFVIPAGDPEAVVRAAGRSQDAFLEIVGDVLGSDMVGPADSRRYGALLLTGVHGITGMEISGHLGTPKWGVSGEDLVDLLVDTIDR